MKGSVLHLREGPHTVAPTPWHKLLWYKSHLSCLPQFLRLDWTLPNPYLPPLVAPSPLLFLIYTLPLSLITLMSQEGGSPPLAGATASWATLATCATTSANGDESNKGKP